MLVDNDEAEVVGIDVGAVVLGEGEGGFELPRQVGGAINRFDKLGRLDRPNWLDRLRATRHSLLLPGLGISQPDLVVGPRPRGEMNGELVELGLHLVADGIAVDRRPGST